MTMGFVLSGSAMSKNTEFDPFFAIDPRLHVSTVPESEQLDE